MKVKTCIIIFSLLFIFSINSWTAEFFQGVLNEFADMTAKIKKNIKIENKDKVVVNLKKEPIKKPSEAIKPIPKPKVIDEKVTNIQKDKKDSIIFEKKEIKDPNHNSSTDNRLWIRWNKKINIYKSNPKYANNNTFGNYKSLY